MSSAVILIEFEYRTYPHGYHPRNNNKAVWVEVSRRLSSQPYDNTLESTLYPTLNPDCLVVDPGLGIEYSLQ